MNRSVSFTLLTSLIISSLMCHSQDETLKTNNKYGFNTGIGYIYVPPAGSHGISMWVEGKKHLRTGFYMALKFQYSHANMKLGNDWYSLEGNYKPDIFYHIDVTFSRPIRISGNQTIEPGVGFLYEKLYSWLPGFEIINEENIIIKNRFGDKWEDLGISFKVDYNYTFKNNVMLGLRTQCAYVTGMVEGIFITPFVGFRF